MNITEYNLEFGRWKTDGGAIDCPDQDDYDACESFFAVPPSEIIVHEDFKDDNVTGISNDIAIVKLEWPIEFTRIVRPVSLPSEGEEVQENQVLELTGFGWFFYEFFKRFL